MHGWQCRRARSRTRHCKKCRRFSLTRIVSGDLQLRHVTYSRMYRRSTLSICFCWNRPRMTSALLESTEPLVPNSANRNCKRWSGCRCSLRNGKESQHRHVRGGDW